VFAVSDVNAIVIYCYTNLLASVYNFVFQIVFNMSYLFYLNLFLAIIA